MRAALTLSLIVIVIIGAQIDVEQLTAKKLVAHAFETAERHIPDASKKSSDSATKQDDLDLIVRNTYLNRA